VPARLFDQQTVAVTTAAATAYYGLHELARIEERRQGVDSFRDGGVGQAAIAIARAAGAEIFATAGSEQRRQSLRDMGIEHV
jgi:polyketide synthase 5